MAFAPKQLGDLLQQQQEPFTPHLYRTKKGCPENTLNLKESSFTIFVRRRELLYKCKSIAGCFRAVKGLLGSFNVKIKNWQKTSNGSQETADTIMEDNYVLSGKRQHKHGNLLGEEEVNIDINLKQNIEEESIQLSPISVQEEILSNKDSPIHNGCILKTLQEELFNSDSCKSLENSLSQKPCGINEHDSFSRYMKIKVGLKQRKQLLFDYVKEILETQRLKDRRNHPLGEPLGAEAIGEVLCNNILVWSKQPLYVNNSKQRLEIDVFASAEEWSEFEQQRKGIGTEIANYILADISSEVVIDFLKAPKDNFLVYVVPASANPMKYCPVLFIRPVC